MTGVIIYLFIFGDAIDAYQSRSISCEERLQSLFAFSSMRGFYFFQRANTLNLHIRFHVKLSTSSNLLSRVTLGFYSFFVTIPQL